MKMDMKKMFLNTKKKFQPSLLLHVFFFLLDI